ncbi:MAG: hypothetical protein SAK29_03900 [Scytonema sp. PMC 1069.18]|nr:hypothetical protein [Scytonema sp. PMC 1069.18]MEC4881015.1 hypothetical protein [Scytonema sp. PMC 1070.18]
MRRGSNKVLSCSSRRSRSYYRQHRLASGRSLVANLLATEAKQDMVSLLNYHHSMQHSAPIR